MKERPILFSGSMIRAILDGRKTQTRRLIRVPPESAPECQVFDPHEVLWKTPNGPAITPVPYEPGNRLWVREAWHTSAAFDDMSPGEVGEWALDMGYQNSWAPLLYVSDGAKKHADAIVSLGEKWGRKRPGIHMPRWASRITLEVTDVRVQRLQDISEADIRAEGVTPELVQEMTGKVFCDPFRIHHAWEAGWDHINGKRASYASNPWVWAVEFKRLPAEEASKA